jgi:hypothetical protein
MNKIKVILIYLVFAATITSCGSLIFKKNNKNQPSTTSEIPIPLLTENVRPSTTLEISNSGNLPLTTSPIMTPTVVPTSMFTRVPALEKKEAEEKLFELLENNGGCDLPCFWGFYPGSSKDSAFTSFLGMLDNINNYTILQIENEGEILSVTLTSRAWRESEPDIIEYILVRTGAFKQREDYKELLFATSDYQKYFEYYRLQNILENYGMPANSYLWIESYEIMNVPDLLILDLDYSQYGFFVSILMPSGWDTEIGFKGCPKYGETTLLLWEPGDSQWRSYWDSYGSLNHKTFEEMTGIAPEEYFEMYLHSPDSCFEFEIPEMKE